MSESGGQFRLQAISTPAPRFPKGAQGITGEVLVAFTVNASGSVENVRAVRGNPPRVFEASAIAAVQTWRFVAPGRSVRTTRTLRFVP